MRNEIKLDRRAEMGVQRDARGVPVGYKGDRHILDPNDPLAVQIPEGLEVANPLDALVAEEEADEADRDDDVAEEAPEADEADDDAEDDADKA